MSAIRCLIGPATKSKILVLLAPSASPWASGLNCRLSAVVGCALALSRSGKSISNSFTKQTKAQVKIRRGESLGIKDLQENFRCKSRCKARCKTPCKSSGPTWVDARNKVAWIQSASTKRKGSNRAPFFACGQVASLRSHGLGLDATCHGANGGQSGDQQRVGRGLRHSRHPIDVDVVQLERGPAAADSKRGQPAEVEHEGLQAKLVVDGQRGDVQTGVVGKTERHRTAGAVVEQVSQVE